MLTAAELRVTDGLGIYIPDLLTLLLLVGVAHELLLKIETRAHSGVSTSAAFSPSGFSSSLWILACSPGADLTCVQPFLRLAIRVHLYAAAFLADFFPRCLMFRVKTLVFKVDTIAQVRGSPIRSHLISCSLLLGSPWCWVLGC